MVRTVASHDEYACEMDTPELHRVGGLRADHGPKHVLEESHEKAARRLSDRPRPINPPSGSKRMAEIS